MSKPFTLELQGIDKLMTALSGMPEKVKKEIGAEIRFAAEEIEATAAQQAPADQGLLRNEISSFKVDELEYDIVSAADYSAFVEFGTRGKAVIPAGLQDYASQYMNRKGATSLGAKEAIFNWCKRKGIDPKAWYPIFLSIMINGTRPHPFFFSALDKVKPKLIERIKNILTDL